MSTFPPEPLSAVAVLIIILYSQLSHYPMPAIRIACQNFLRRVNMTKVGDPSGSRAT